MEEEELDLEAENASLKLALAERDAEIVFLREEKKFFTASEDEIQFNDIVDKLIDNDLDFYMFLEHVKKLRTGVFSSTCFQTRFQDRQ